MTTRITDLAGWHKANEALALAMESTLEFLATEPPSDDPDSPFQRAQTAMIRINWESGRLAIAALEQIDDAIAASGLITEISALSEQAKEEAERLKDAAKTIQGIANAVNMITGVVTKIVGLPFL